MCCTITKNVKNYLLVAAAGHTAAAAAGQSVVAGVAEGRTAAATADGCAERAGEAQSTGAGYVVHRSDEAVAAAGPAPCTS